MLMWAFAISVYYSDKVVNLNKPIDLKAFHDYNNFYY